MWTNPVQNSFYEKAYTLRLENMFKEAVSSYLNAILIDRNNFDSYFGLGICYKNLKQYGKAIKYLDIASELNKITMKFFMNSEFATSLTVRLAEL